MVAANPFKSKEKVDMTNIDLNKIIEEEKTHNHGPNVEIENQLPGASELAKTTAIEDDTSISDIEQSPFIKHEDKGADDIIKSNNNPKVSVENKDLEENTKSNEISTQNEPVEQIGDSIIKPSENSFELPKPPRLDDFENSNITHDSATSSTPIVEELEEPVLDSPIPSIEDKLIQDNKKMPILTRMKKWCWKHRGLFIVLAIIIIGAIACFFIDRNLNKVELSVRSSGLRLTYDKNNNGEKIPTDLPVRVLAYSADSGEKGELLYSSDTVAKANPDGTMNIAWDVPRNVAYMRSTYNEFCVFDESKANGKINDYCSEYGNSANSSAAISDSSSGSSNKYNRISCAYYIPSRTNGLVAHLSGWNRLDDSQKIGCASEDDEVWGKESYLSKFESSEDSGDNPSDESSSINNTSVTEYVFSDNTSKNIYNTNVTNSGDDHIVYQYASPDRSVQYRRWASGYQELHARKSVAMNDSVGTVGSGHDWWWYDGSGGSNPGFNSVWASSNKKAEFKFSQLGIPGYKEYNETPIAQCGVQNSEAKLVTLDKVTKEAASCLAGNSKAGAMDITYNISVTGYYNVNS